jgi:aminopeptidase N
VRFTPLAESTFLELADAAELRVVVDGTTVPAACDAGRIALGGLTPGVVTEVTVEARLPYVTHGDGMHIFTDPADGETYVSAYCGMDIAHRVFACFDQNDLKGPIALTVAADPAWTVLGNGPAARPRRRAARDVRPGAAGRRTDPAAARVGGRAGRPPLRRTVRRGRRTWR